jgi:hypothetical protein
MISHKKLTSQLNICFLNCETAVFCVRFSSSLLLKLCLLFIDTCNFRVASYFTNTLILPVINGPTEGLMLIYVSHLFTFFVGNFPKQDLMFTKLSGFVC